MGETFQRIYVNGRRTSTSKPKDLAQARLWLSNLETHWRESVGRHGANQGVTVDRVTEDELIVVTTNGVTLRVVNVVQS